MSRPQILPALVGVALLATLTGCLPFPLPQRPAPSPSVETIEPDVPVDPAVVEDLMMGAMPVVGSDYDIEEQRGLGELTFGSDWSEIDHNAVREARAVRIITSPGWVGTTSGPAYRLLFEVIYMGSDQAAETAINDFALSVQTPSTSTADDGSSTATYEPVTTPTGRWPFGAVEQTREISWTTGESAVGWSAHFAVGPFIALVYTSATPDDASVAALNAFADEYAPGYVAAVEALPGQLP